MGLATVVLPTGWQERLAPLADESGRVRAYCLEVHDTCVSKLMAGREKDFIFIKELLELVTTDTFNPVIQLSPGGVFAPRECRAFR